MNVPRDVFTGGDARIDERKKESFGRMLRGRYPWLTEGSLEVLFRSARREMLRVLDEESGGRNESRRMRSKGDVEGAIAHLRTHLEEDPEDADAWYALGELLCESGKAEEGYAAFAEGRRHFRRIPASPADVPCGPGHKRPPLGVRFSDATGERRGFAIPSPSVCPHPRTGRNPRTGR